jgi:hypothetical protein
MSFAERKAQLARASAPHLVEGDHMVRDIDQPLPGDTGFAPRLKRSKPELSQKRSQYFEDAFSTNGLGSAARERIRSEAIIVAEVQTNVIVRPHTALCQS